MTDFVIPFGVLAGSGVADVIAVGTETGPVPMFPALTLELDWTTATFDVRYPAGADYVTDWVRNARYVADGPVVTTAGVSASVPVSIALVEAIAGREVAAEVAQELGIAEWSAVHSSAGFRLRRHVGTAAGNWLAFWRKERVAIAVEDGVDELALALVADLWSRTYRSRALTFSAESDVVLTRSGLRLRVDGAGMATTAHRTVTLPQRSDVGAAIPETLSLIAAAHGRSTAAWVASQIEYPWP